MSHRVENRRARRKHLIGLERPGILRGVKKARVLQRESTGATAGWAVERPRRFRQQVRAGLDPLGSGVERCG